MNKVLYYSFCIEREGSWQRSDGFVMSDDKVKLQKKIASLPEYGADLSWEYDMIKEIEVSMEKFELFLKKSKQGIYFGDDFEWKKFE